MRKVIHSYSNLYLKGSDKSINFLSQALSAICAKKVYGEIEFWGNKVVVDFLDETGISSLYDNIETIPDDFVGYYDIFASAGKFYSLLRQDKPVIHIDGDTFLFAPLEYDNCDIFFAHQDIHSDSLNTIANIKSAYDCYVFPWKYFIQEEHDLNYFDLNDIYNMNVIGVENIELANKVWQKVLDVYTSYKDRFHKGVPHWHIAEQFFTGYYCRKMNINTTSLYKMISQWVDDEGNFYFENTLHSGNKFAVKNGFVPEDVFPMTHASSHWLKTPQLQSWVKTNLLGFGHEKIIEKVTNWSWIS